MTLVSSDSDKFEILAFLDPFWINFPHKKHDTRKVYNVQETATVNNVAKSVTRIYVVVENRQADHQASAMELKGIITNQPISILIDPRSNLNYISLRFFEECSL